MRPQFKVVTCCSECPYLVKLSGYIKFHYRCTYGCKVDEVPIERPSDCPLPKPEE